MANYKLAAMALSVSMAAGACNGEETGINPQDLPNLTAQMRAEQISGLKLESKAFSEPIEIMVGDTAVSVMREQDLNSRGFTLETLVRDAKNVELLTNIGQQEITVGFGAQRIGVQYTVKDAAGLADLLLFDSPGDVQKALPGQTEAEGLLIYRETNDVDSDGRVDYRLTLLDPRVNQTTESFFEIPGDPARQLRIRELCYFFDIEFSEKTASLFEALEAAEPGSVPGPQELETMILDSLCAGLALMVSAKETNLTYAAYQDFASRQINTAFSEFGITLPVTVFPKSLWNNVEV